MLDELGINSVEDIYKSIIPDELLYKERLDIPEPIRSEYELKRHVMGILNRELKRQTVFENDKVRQKGKKQ